MSDPKKLPDVDPVWVASVFGKLELMEVRLDDNPLEFGPRRLNNKVAEARRLLSDCEKIFVKVSGNVQKFRAALRSTETQIELEKKHLLTNDPETRAGRSASERDAIATTKPQVLDLVRESHRLRAAVEDLEAVLSIVRTKRSDLRDVQGRIRDQIRLCHEEIGLGARWGSKVGPGEDAPDLDASPNVDKKSLRDLQHMFEGVDTGEADLAQAVDFSLESDEDDENLIKELVGHEGEDTDSFLEQISTEPETPQEVPKKRNVDDLLDDIL